MWIQPASAVAHLCGDPHESRGSVPPAACSRVCSAPPHCQDGVPPGARPGFDSSFLLPPASGVKGLSGHPETRGGGEVQAGWHGHLRALCALVSPVLLSPCALPAVGRAARECAVRVRRPPCIAHADRRSSAASARFLVGLAVCAAQGVAHPCIGTIESVRSELF